jgi:hypothetical protein
LLVRSVDAFEGRASFIFTYFLGEGNRGWRGLQQKIKPRITRM